MSTGFSLSGTDLRTMAHEIRVVDGWDAFPSSRVGVTQYPFRHGEVHSSESFYNARDISLGMVVLPYDGTTGTITTTPLEHIQENLDSLFRLFGAPGQLPLVRTMPDGSQRQADVRVIDTFEVSGNVGDTRIFVVRMRMPIPFWKELPVDTFSGSGSLINNGNAPVGDFTITFGGAGSVTHSSLGDQIVATGACVVSITEFSIESGGSPVDNLVTCNSPWMFRLMPGTNTIAASGSVTFSYYHSWF